VLDRLTALDPSSLVEGSELRNLWKAPVAFKAPVTAAAGPAPAVAIALPLIKEFEGCRLKVYPDPASGDELFTIGWGCTSYGDDRRVQAGDAISQEQADTLLVARDVAPGIWSRVNESPHPARLGRGLHHETNPPQA